MSQNFQRIMSKESFFLQFANQLPSKKNPFFAISSPAQITIKNKKKYHEDNKQKITIPISPKDCLKLHELQSTNETIQTKNTQISQLNAKTTINKEIELSIKDFSLNSPKSTTRYFKDTGKIYEKEQETENILTEVKLNKSSRIRLSSQQNWKSQEENFVFTNRYKKNYLSQSVLTDNDVDDKNTLSSTLSSARTCELLSNSQSSCGPKSFKFQKIRLTRGFRNKENLFNQP